MIQNIILDMGNVLLRYDPDRILDELCGTPEEKELIRQQLFCGKEWAMGDAGEITNEERYDLVKERLPEHVHGALRRVVDHWWEYMPKVAGAQDFCTRQQARGYRLYVLSNACNRFFTYFPNGYDMDMFDGIMVSSRVHLVKPDARIYELLCDTYGLQPSECIFIDDMQANVEAARACGMAGVVFDGDWEKVCDILYADAWQGKKSLQGIQQPQAVVFDMDGVIFDSEIKVIECWRAVAEQHGLTGIEAPCHESLGTTTERTGEIMRAHFGADFPYEEYNAKKRALFVERYGEGRLPRKKGIEELLRFLKERGIKTAVASSTRREAVCRELTDGGLLPYFDAVICGDEVTHSKPHPEIFLTACERLGVAPEHALGIEDSYNGIRALHAAGMTAVMVPDLKSPTEEMHRLADAILPDLLAVRDALAQNLEKR